SGKSTVPPLRRAKIGKSELTSTECNFAILVRNQRHELKSGIEQRDAAVMVDAKNATTMVLKGGKLVIPSVTNGLAKDFPRARCIFRIHNY
ncbi:MAG: DUF4443 domain-containing protein, partial [Candidatus Bathyarchaeia archaeon]